MIPNIKKMNTVNSVALARLLSNHMLINHYNDVMMGVIASRITSLTIVYSIFIQTQIKEITKAQRHWPLCGEFTGDRWIPRTNSQWRGTCFQLMTSSWHMTDSAYGLIPHVMTEERMLTFPLVRLYYTAVTSCNFMFKFHSPIRVR